MSNRKLRIKSGDGISEGERFMELACSGENSLLEGYNGIMPFTDVDKTWKANPKDDNGVSITTNKQLCKCLIDWYDYFSDVFKLDANILAAQAFQESKFALWNFPKIRTDGISNSTATGISQFLLTTIYDIIVLNKCSMGNANYKFTNNEISLITNGCTGDIKSEDTYKKSSFRRINRPIIHQNAMDNPKIMIKAQFVYMKYISEKCKNIASIALYAYNRGHDFIPKNNISYTNTINRTIVKNGSEYPKEGIDYVFRIFNYLGNPTYNCYTIDNIKFNACFGYNKPPHNIDCNTDNFNEFDAQCDESNLMFTN